MITEDKVTELFCMADDFCKFFDAMMEKYTLKSDKKRRYHRDSTMSKAEIMLIMILFHASGYRCLKHFSIFAIEIKHKLADKDSLYMEYLSVVQFAEKHGISTRTARNYCAAGKIDGAFLTGKTWNIPADAGLL